MTFVTSIPLADIAVGSAQYQIMVTGSTPFTPAYTLATNLVGANGLNALTWSSGTSIVAMTAANNFALQTATQVTALLDLFSTSATTKGLVPGSNGVGTTYFLRADGTWAIPAGSPDTNLLTFVLAIGTPATTGTNKTNQIIITRSCTIQKAYISAKTGPTGAALIVDINKNGTSIWNTTQANRLQIAAAATYGTQTSFDTTSLAEGDLLTIDIDQIGSGTAGQDITVVIKVL